MRLITAVMGMHATAALAHSKERPRAGSIPDQDWGYVQVRPGCQMFWWLYGSTSTVLPRDQQPTILWLQGGPGAASSGYGNFAEMGPLDETLQPRNTTWVQSANVLYVDQPVGSGYSYCNDVNDLTTNLTQIVDDLVTFSETFFGTLYPSLQTAPFYGFCESYGGKMMAAYAVGLLAAFDSGAVTVNFKGIALGDSWICPECYVDTWGEWLRLLSVMDGNQYATQLLPAVQACDADVAAGNWAAATNDWGNVEDVIEATTDGISFYNVLQHNTPDDLARRRALAAGLSQAALSVIPDGVDSDTVLRLFARHAGFANLKDGLDTLMNGPIKQQLQIIPSNVTWGGQSDAVFAAQSGDFMRPVVDIVDVLLNQGRINVTIYTGQLDLICGTSGTELWMSKLTWPGYPYFYSSAKTPLYPFVGSQSTGGFVKQFQQLFMYYIMDAGHMLPADNGQMALNMMQLITGQ